MNTYTVQLKSKAMVADHTLELTLERPRGFDYIAGQFLMLRVMSDDPALSERDKVRSMSIASAPAERDLMLVMRIPEQPSAYKKILMGLEPGAQLEIKGPLGHFTLHEDTSRPAVFIAGGIGITPFRAMILQELAQPAGYTMRLLYSNRNKESTAYFDDLKDVALPGYRSVYTMTKMAPEDAAAIGCTTGYIDGPFITAHCADLKHPLYYIVGLPQMVVATKQALIDLGIPTADIRVELYPGY